jgi:hypothetical protein
MSNTQNKFPFYSDNGHGWFEVSMSQLESLGLRDKISTFSYYNPDEDMAYLEEDCDAGHLHNALTERGIEFSAVRMTPVDNSLIRELPRYPYAKKTYPNGIVNR